MRFLFVFALVSCTGLVDGTEDGYWDDTHDDTGDDTRALAANKSVVIDPGTTSDAELVKELPVARSEGAATKRIALRTAVPPLAAGDRLIAPAEVQVTTRCDVGQVAPGCDYSPSVRAQLVLVDRADDRSGKVIATQSVSCTKAEHHCMFVFTPSEATIDITRPCATCFVNLVLWAWDGHARSGEQDKVLVGGNDGNYLDNGKVEGDVSRLMIVRERNVGAADRAMRETSGGGSFTLNTNANEEVAYEHRLKDGDVEAGEQFVVEAKIVGDVGGRARLSAQLAVTNDAKFGPSQISEQNGFNCNPGGACVLHKVAVFRATDHIAGPVSVKVLVKSAVPGGGSTRVTIRRNDGFVRSVRYRAAIIGR